MANIEFEFLFKTKGNASPKGKPRVYFTCHPEDFGRSFNKICEDIFASHDCAIYYTADMSADIPEENRATDLDRMNLFVIPVTFRLLSQPNRAMDSDFRFAQEKHIPVLPIMMESGIDCFYSQPDKFGSLQYLNPYSTDLTEIGYAEKLKKYLESVLISDELAKRVRAAFDAYIFLSYRKKDRHLANELMRRIHSKPEFRDIAVWYDEFLTPGESFNENIDRILHDSKMFTLLVTPNLLEEPDGKPNFVMSTEYPAARDAGMNILPAEMEQTDKNKLAEKYVGLPECVHMEDNAFHQRLLETISNIAKRENDEDPVHNYLIGLAYLDGIDVEIDRERGMELITFAAEAGLPEAMAKLYGMYYEGNYVKLDWQRAKYWAEKLAEKNKELYGEEHPDTLISLGNLAYTYGELGEYKKTLDLQEKVYGLRRKILGEEHPDTLNSLNNLASTYGKLGNHEKQLELNEKVCSLRWKILGEEHPDTLSSLNNLAYTYVELGEYKKALDLQEKVYDLRCKILGEEHPGTLRSLGNLAYTYGDLGEHKKALELEEKVYDLRCKIFGEEHPDTLISLGNLAYTYGVLGEYKKALELEKKVYGSYCKILGEEHPDTLTSLSNLAYTYGKLGEQKKALELEEKVYALSYKILGEEHPDTLSSLNNLAYTYGDLGEHKKALDLQEKVYGLRRKILGEEHPDTLRSLNNLAATYGNIGEYKKALELEEKVYDLRCKILGEEHPDTLSSLGNLAYTYGDLGEHKKALELEEKVYDLRCKIFGEEHPDTLISLGNLAYTYGVLGEHKKALELKEKA